MSYNLTTLTEEMPNTNLNTGNPLLSNANLRSPLDDIFDEDEERFEDDLFGERHSMSQEEFNDRIMYGQPI